MNDFFLLLLSVSLSASLVAASIFLFVQLFKGRLSATWRYYIWLIVIVRLVLPFAPANNLVENMFSAAAGRHKQTEINQTNEGLANDILTQELFREETNSLLPSELIPQKTAESESAGIDRLGYFMLENLHLFWLCIALILFVQRWTRYGSFMRFIRAGSFPVTDEQVTGVYQRVCRDMKIGRAPALYLNKTIVSPMLTGLFRPAVHLPRGDFSEDQLGYIFRHELIHYKRGDVLYKWLLEIIGAIHWFNPVIYPVIKEIHRQCELSCDEKIIGELSRSDKQFYGDTLIAVIKDAGNYLDKVAVATMNENVKLLKERLEFIMNHNKKTRFSVILSLTLVLFLSVEAVYAGAYISPFKKVKAALNVQGEKNAEAEGRGIKGDEPFEASVVYDDNTGSKGWNTTINMEGGTYRFISTRAHYVDGYIIVAEVSNYLADGKYPEGINKNEESMVVIYTEETKAFNGNTAVQKGLEAIYDQIRNKEWINFSDKGAFYLTVKEVKGPYNEAPDILAQRFYGEKNISLFQSVVAQVGETTYKDLVNKSVEDGQIAFFSVLMDRADTTFDFDSLAQKLYEDSSISFFSVIQERVSNEKKTALLDRTAGDGKISFFSVLLDDSTGLDYYKYAKQAYDSNQVAFFSVVKGHLTEKEKSEFLNRAYEDGKIAFFSVLVNSDISDLDREALRQKAFNDNKRDIFYILWD